MHLKVHIKRRQTAGGSRDELNEITNSMLFSGMDLRLWKQAQADNPDPENYIPVPIIGFSEVSDK